MEPATQAATQAQADWIITVERWIRLAADHGVSFVFLACVLLLLLWLAVTAVGLLKKWVPAWFAWSIRSHRRTCIYLDKSTEVLSCIHEKAHTLIDSQSSIVKAALATAEREKERLGIGSDVIIYLEAADQMLNTSRNRRHVSPVGEEPTYDWEPGTDKYTDIFPPEGTPGTSSKPPDSPA